MILQVDGREGVVNRDNETCGVIHTIRQRMGLVTGSPRYSGNVFVLRARSQVERDEWVRMIRTSMLLAKQSDAKNAYSWAYLKYRAFSMKMRWGSSFRVAWRESHRHSPFSCSRVAFPPHSHRFRILLHDLPLLLDDAPNSPPSLGSVACCQTLLFA